MRLHLSFQLDVNLILRDLFSENADNVNFNLSIT